MDFDDFDDGFDDGEFMDDSDGDFGSEDLFDENSGVEDAPRDNECDDNFTVEDAVMSGVAFGWGYEEGLEEGKRRKLEKKMNEDRDKRNNHS